MSNQLFQSALVLHQNDRLVEAERLYRQVLTRDPRHADALHLLGVLLGQQGQPDAAIELIRRAVDSNPRVPEYYNNMGIFLVARGKNDEARAMFTRAIQLKPGYGDAHYNLGNLLKDTGAPDGAIEQYNQAIRFNPTSVDAHNNLAKVLSDKSRIDEAIVACKHALQLKGDSAETLNNLGYLLSLKGDPPAAIAALNRAIALNPKYAEAHYNLGNVLKTEWQIDEAAAAYRNAIAVRPDYGQAYNNLGNVLKERGNIDEAIAAYRRAAELDPADPTHLSNVAYLVGFHPAYDAAAILRESVAFNAKYAPALRSAVKPHKNEPSPARRLRVGYVSPDFREHCQAFFTTPLLENHDHGDFEIFCYSSATRPDMITSNLRACADTWRDVATLSDADLAETVRRDQIDILVDLTMHMAGGRPLLFARKPAPVQVAWLAYPGTTGLETMDYRITDPHLDLPGTDRHYTEKSVRLPETFWCYNPLSKIEVNPLPAETSGQVTFGCLNNFCKINGKVIDLWAKVLQMTPKSRLLLLAPMGEARKWTLERFARNEIESERIEFVGFQSRENYLATYHRIDIGLDTFPANGHTTSLDSFWMGAPVVTLVGQGPLGRAGWSQLNNLGLRNLAAEGPEKFVGIAASLAGDLPRLARLRSTLRGRMERSALMNGKQFTQNMESAYREMWHAWCSKQLINM